MNHLRSAIGLLALSISFGALSEGLAQWLGNGTPQDPYLLSTAADLNALGDDSDFWDKHFRVGADIDLAGGAISPVIGAFDSNLSFSGVIDGAGHVIENLASDGSGIVHLNTGTIRDLTVRHAEVHLADTPFAGIIAARNSGVIESCFVIGGSITGGASTGGITGENVNGGKIFNCWSSCSLFPSGAREPVEIGGGIVGCNRSLVVGCKWTGTVIGEGINGGIAGENSGAIMDCYATGVAERDADFGGIVGINSGSIANCYSIATTDNDPATVRAGGIVSSQSPDQGTVIACFWDYEATGFDFDGAGSSGLSTELMQTTTTFASVGWEVEGSANSPLWFAPTGGGYLRLWWEVGAPAPPPFASGAGSIADPYLIATPAQFTKIGRRIDLLRSHFRITADLDFSAHPNPTAGSILLPFSGSLDGGGHLLTGLLIDGSSGNGSGLFGSARGAAIHDLTIEDSVITAGAPAGAVAARANDCQFDRIIVLNPMISARSTAGGLVGTLSGGTIRDCRSLGGSVSCDPETSGSVGGLAGSIGRDTSVERCESSTAASAGAGVGGLIGTISGPFANVSDCRASGDVDAESHGGGFVGQISGIGLGQQPGRPIIQRCSATGDVRGDRQLGGFVGEGSSGSCRQCFATGNVTGTGDDIGGFLGSKYRGISYFDCYALGDVSGNERVGGFVGSHYSDWRDTGFLVSYAAGAVSGNADVGGFIGKFTSGTNYPLSTSFWDMATSGTVHSDGGNGLWTGAMHSRNTFEQIGWDFFSTWTIAPGEYPRLQWDTGGNLFEDSDGDRLPDPWEAQFTQDITLFEGEDDADSDGLTNKEEYDQGTDASSADSDADGYTDFYEINQLTDPNDASSQPDALTQRLFPTDPPNHVLRFGHDVAISGDTIVVGAPGSVPGQVAPKIITVPGASDFRAPGIVYVFRRTLGEQGPRWVQILTLEPTDPRDVGFGSSVDIDGDVVAVGCWNAAAYAFDLRDPAQTARLDVSGNNPAQADIETTLDVALHGDTLIVGSPTDSEAGNEAGAAFFFEFQGGSWELVNKLVGTTPEAANRFGVAVSLWGNNAAIGSGPYLPNNNHRLSGNVEIYRSAGPGDGWVFETKIDQPMSQRHTVERFGSEISIHRDFLAAAGINSTNDGDYGPTAASLFYRHQGGFAEWEELATPGFQFGEPSEDDCFCYQGPFKVATRGRTMLIGTTRGTYVMQRRFLDLEEWTLTRRYYPAMMPTPTDAGESRYGSAVDLSGQFMVTGAAVTDGAWVTPINPPAAFPDWLALHFRGSQLGSPQITALSADPDSDGLNNLLEFGLGLDPSSAEADDDSVPSIRHAIGGAPEAQRLTLAFSLPEPMPEGITHVVEASDDLVQWETIATRGADELWTGAAEVAEHIASDGRRFATVHDTVELPNGATRYLRLGVRLANPE